MSNYLPTRRTALTTSIATATAGLTGDATAVIMQLQAKLTDGKGAERAATGDTFTNGVVLRLFAFDNQDQPHLVPSIWAGFDNHISRANGAAPMLAKHLTEQLITTGEMDDLQYCFKLIDATSLECVVGDHPGYEAKAEDTTAEWLKPVATKKPVNKAPRDPNVIAYLHIYAVHGDNLIKVGQQDLDKSIKPQYDRIVELAKAGTHFQAAAQPMAKLAAWLDQPKVEASAVPFDVAGFAKK